MALQITPHWEEALRQAIDFHQGHALEYPPLPATIAVYPLGQGHEDAGLQIFLRGESGRFDLCFVSVRQLSLLPNTAPLESCS